MLRPIKYFSKFQNLGHVTDDVIIGSRDQNSKKNYKICQNKFQEKSKTFTTASVPVNEWFNNN